MVVCGKPRDVSGCYHIVNSVNIFDWLAIGVLLLVVLGPAIVTIGIVIFWKPPGYKKPHVPGFPVIFGKRDESE